MEKKFVDCERSLGYRIRATVINLKYSIKYLIVSRRNLAEKYKYIIVNVEELGL